MASTSESREDGTQKRDAEIEKLMSLTQIILEEMATADLHAVQFDLTSRVIDVDLSD